MPCVTSQRAGRNRVDLGAGQETETPRSAAQNGNGSGRGTGGSSSTSSSSNISDRHGKRNPFEVGEERGFCRWICATHQWIFPIVTVSFGQDRSRRTVGWFATVSAYSSFRPLSEIQTRSTACVLLARYLAIHRGTSREQP